MLSHSESLRLLLGMCLADELHHSGVGQRGDVTQLVCMKGREGGEGTSGESWGWGLTWEVALKGVCGKCALLASMCARCTKNFSSVRACVCPERCL